MTRAFGFWWVALGVLSGTLYGEIRSYEIQAVIAELHDPHELLEGAVAVGHALTATYTFETTTPDADPRPAAADYWHLPGSPGGLAAEVSGLAFETDPGDSDFRIVIGDDPSLDEYLVDSRRNLDLANGTRVDGLAIVLEDWSGSALSSVELRPTPPVLAAFPERSVFVSGAHPSSPGFFQLRAEIQSIDTPPPAITLLEPEAGERIIPTATVVMEANAFDWEDGDLSGALSWRSSRDGELGLGAVVRTRLSPGVHTISASVEDSDGRSSQESVTIELAVSPDAEVITLHPVVAGTGLDGWEAGQWVVDGVVESFAETPLVSASKFNHNFEQFGARYGVLEFELPEVLRQADAVLQRAELFLDTESFYALPPPVGIGVRAFPGNGVLDAADFDLTAPAAAGAAVTTELTVEPTDSVAALAAGGSPFAGFSFEAVRGVNPGVEELATFYGEPDPELGWVEGRMSSLRLTYSAGHELADAGADQFLQDNHTTLEARPVIHGSGEWRIESGGAVVLSSLLDPGATVSGLAPGETVLRWDVRDSKGLRTDDTVSLHFTPDPPSYVVVLDNDDPGNGSFGYHDNFLHREDPAYTPTGSVGATARISSEGISNRLATWRPGLEVSGRYRLSASWPDSDTSIQSFSPAAPFIVSHDGGQETVSLDQSSASALHPAADTGGFVPLGVFALVREHFHQVELPNTVPQHVIADALKLELLELIYGAGPDQWLAEPLAVLSADDPSTFWFEPCATCVGTWNVLEGSGTFSDPHDSDATVSGLSAGANRFEWSVVDGAWARSADTVVVHYEEPFRLVVDNEDPGYGDTFIGSSPSYFPPGVVGENAHVSYRSDRGTSATWTFSVPDEGIYLISAAWPDPLQISLSGTYSPAAPFFVEHRDGIDRFEVDQTRGSFESPAADPEGFRALGDFWLLPGRSYTLTLENSVPDRVIADAVKIELLSRF